MYVRVFVCGGVNLVIWVLVKGSFLSIPYASVLYTHVMASQCMFLHPRITSFSHGGTLISSSNTQYDLR